MVPYDRSIWRQLKDPLWWIITGISLIPAFGCSQTIFTIMFLFLDKHDEYQLIKFIVAFKTNNFISQGIISALIGAAMYFNCITKDNPTCNDDGPGAYPGF